MHSLHIIKLSCISLSPQLDLLHDYNIMKLLHYIAPANTKLILGLERSLPSKFSMTEIVS